MYVEIDRNLTDVVTKREDGDGKTYKYFSAVENYFTNVFINKINESLANVKIENPELPSVRIVEYARTDFSEMEYQKGYYCCDFYIQLKNSKNLYKSLPLRFSAGTRSVSAGAIGVKCEMNNPNASVSLGVWEGTKIHKSGKVPVWTDYSISATSCTSSNYPMIEAKGNNHRIWCGFSYIITENSFFLFTKKNRRMKNIISFIGMEDCLQKDKFVWYTNGWAGDGREISESTKWDGYIKQSIIESNIQTEDLILAPYFVQNSTDKNIKLYAPDMYFSNQARIDNGSVIIGKHINLSTGELEYNKFIIFVANTLPIGSGSSKKTFAVKLGEFDGIFDY